MIAVSKDGGVNLKVRGLTGTWGGVAVGIKVPKFEAKKGDFAKMWQKLGGGGYSPQPPGSAVLEFMLLF